MAEEDVIVVPGDRREELLAGDEMVRVESDDHEGWEEPKQYEVGYMKQFVSGKYRHNGPPEKSWTAATGMRFGYCSHGVYIHANHRKRFFGILREHASVMLRTAIPVAVPVFVKGGFGGGTDSTDRLLSKLVSNMPAVSNEMREGLLKATFKQADINKNGVLSRPELGTMMRRVCNTMSGQDIREIMDLADADKNNNVSYEEFAHWLTSQAPDGVTSKITKALESHADIVLATFRVWDSDGDGTISDRELCAVIKETCKHFEPTQVKALVGCMDTDSNGKVDYNEFVDFLFRRK